MPKRLPAAPRHLSPRAKRLWKGLLDEFQIDDVAALELLRRACEASDRADQARAEVERDGVTFTNRFGERKVHPAASIERDSRTALRQFLRELRVTEPPSEDLRSPRLGRVS